MPTVSSVSTYSATGGRQAPPTGTTSLPRPARHRAAGGTVKIAAQDLAGTQLGASPPPRSAAAARPDAQLSATWPGAPARSPSPVRRGAAVLTAATCAPSSTDPAQRTTMATGPPPTAGAPDPAPTAAGRVPIAGRGAGPGPAGSPRCPGTRRRVHQRQPTGSCPPPRRCRPP